MPGSRTDPFWPLGALAWALCLVLAAVRREWPHLAAADVIKLAAVMVPVLAIVAALSLRRFPRVATQAAAACGASPALIFWRLRLSYLWPGLFLGLPLAALAGAALLGG